MKCGVWLMILLAATFIAWSPYLCETVKAETPQVPKKRTEKLNLDGLPDKNPKKKIDLFSDEKLPPEVKTKERFKLIDDLGIISDEKLPEKVETIVPSVGPSGIHHGFQMITNDMSGETFVLDIRSGAVWSTKPYARKFIQCTFVNGLGNN